MNIARSYIKGIQEATLRPKIAFVLWLVNFSFGSVLYFLFSAVLSASALANSLSASELLKKADMNAILEFLTSSGVSLGALLTVAFVLIVLYFMVSLFLYGGILHCLVRPREQESFTQAFFAGGGKYFGRFFRLSVCSVILWIPAILVFIGLDILLGAIDKDPAQEQLSFYFTIGRIVFALFIFFLMKMIMDYARIKIAVDDSRSVFRTLIAAVGFIFRKLAKALALYYLLGLTGWAAFLVYLKIQSTFAKSSELPIFLGFIIAQLYIGFRGWLKTAYQAGQWTLFKTESF
jgi:hypothetical protein